MTSTKHSGQEVNQCIKDIRAQTIEQVRALETRTEVENAILCDISDFLKKRAEIEAEYASKLDKLAKSAMLKHKNEKTKRQNWPMFTVCSLWQQLVDHTKEEARQRSVTVDVFGTQIPQAIASRTTLNAKIIKKVKEIILSEHSDVYRVLEELCKAMSDYHKLFTAANAAKFKLQAAEAEKQKNEKSAKKQKALDKQLQKFEAARAVCNRSRNEYLLSIEAANAALYQYYANDLSDFIDCTNVGYEFWMNMVLTNIIAARKAVCQQEMNSLANLSSFRESFDTDFDKHRFFESNSSIFQLPKSFDFKRGAGEQINQIVTASPLGEELELRGNQIKKRLEIITKESEQCLADLEQQANHLKTLISTSVLLEITPEGLQDNRPQKEVTDRSIEETCFVYIDIFRRHLLNGNLISRLESRITAIDNAIKNNDFGVDRNNLSTTGTQSPMFSEELSQRLRIKKRGSSTNDYSPDNPFSNKKPKLFGGSLDEYLNTTGEQIPSVVLSCIRVLSQHGLHHQGLFRISGSTNEINLMKEAFENGEDPLVNVSSPSDMNSVACLLKCYFRELREPLFPVCLFDQFTACAKAPDFLVQVLPLMSKLSRGRYLVLRYLFAFLNDLSHYSDENMMDSSNLAICFGPTLLPTPEDKNQVLYQNLVNDLVRNLIEKHEQVFSLEIPGPKYHVFDDGIAFADDGEEPFGTMTTESEFTVHNVYSTSQMMTNSFHGLPSEHNGLPGRDKRIAAAAAAIVQNRRSMYGDSSNGVMSPIMTSYEDGDERRILSPRTIKTLNLNPIATMSASSTAGRTSLSGESTSSSNNQKENGVVSASDSPNRKGTIIKSISVLQERVSIDNGSLLTTTQSVQNKSPALPSTSSSQSISTNSGRIRIPGKMRSTALTAQITYEDKEDPTNISSFGNNVFSNGKTTPISTASSSSSPRILSAFSGSTSEEQLLDNNYAVEVNQKSQQV